MQRALNAILVLAIVLVLLAGLHYGLRVTREPLPVRHPEPSGIEPVATGAKGYLFTADWFSRAIPAWWLALSDRAGASELHYLEVGAFEGRSLLWMLDNVLTAPSARATVVDPFFDPAVERRFHENLKRSGHPEKVIVRKGLSQVELRRLPLDAFDVIYIDGSHTADDVLADAALSWGLLKEGGLLIFDDYLSKGARTTPESRPLPPQLTPQLALNAFVSAYLHRLRVVHRGYQLLVEKVGDPCPSKWNCSPIGPYLYFWDERRLYEAGGGEPIQLTAGQLDLIERILHARAFGRTGFMLDETITADPEHDTLRAILRLELEPLDPYDLPPR